jgi:ABC-type uncharacterized transport system substrate-binding protein
VIERRAFLAGVGAICTLPRGAAAQEHGRRYRIGVLSPGGPNPAHTAFEEVLPRYGWVPGQNVVIEYRYARGDLQRLPSFVADLLRLRVDLLLVSSAAIPAATAATRTVPIVMTFAVDDPVEAGWVVSLARPGGNVTGVTLYAPELTGKRLEIIKAMLPGARRVAILAWRGPGTLGQVKAASAAAQSLGLEHQVVEVGTAADYDATFATINRERVDALLVLSSPAFFSERRRIADLALKYRLPIVAPFREVAEAGALLAYGPNVVDLWRDRVPVYVDRILRGAKPADVPIEQPTKFELVINAKTAKALGLTIPPSLLLRADHVIE